MFKVDTPSSDSSEQVSSITDGNLVSCYHCRLPLALDLPVPANAVEAILVGTARCTVVLGSDRRIEKTQDIQRITLPAGLKRLRLVHPTGQPGLTLNEVLFR